MGICMEDLNLSRSACLCFYDNCNIVPPVLDTEDAYPSLKAYGGCQLSSGTI